MIKPLCRQCEFKHKCTAVLVFPTCLSMTMMMTEGRWVAPLLNRKWKRITKWSTQNEFNDVLLFGWDWHVCSFIFLQKKGKRKGLGGLSPEKKKLLKVRFLSLVLHAELWLLRFRFTGVRFVFFFTKLMKAVVLESWNQQMFVKEKFAVYSRMAWTVCFTDQCSIWLWTKQWKT